MSKCLTLRFGSLGSDIIQPYRLQLAFSVFVTSLRLDIFKWTESMTVSTI